VSDRFTFIAVKTTADFIVPATAASQTEFNRKAANAFKGLIGGVLRVGDLRDRPTQDPIANHLLCDGRTISRLNYPELVSLLAGSAATEATLPDYSGALSITAPTVTQEVTSGGTVQTEETAPVDQGGAGGTEGGNVPSGSRTYDPNFPYPIWYNPPEIGG